MCIQTQWMCVLPLQSAGAATALIPKSHPLGHHLVEPVGQQQIPDWITHRIWLESWSQRLTAAFCVMAEAAPLVRRGTQLRAKPIPKTPECFLLWWCGLQRTWTRPIPKKKKVSTGAKYQQNYKSCNYQAARRKPGRGGKLGKNEALAWELGL